MTESDKPAFMEAMIALAVALRDQPPDVVTMRVYFKALNDLEIEFVTAAAERLIADAQFFPKTTEWRAAVKKVEAERVEAQRAHLRKFSAPVCSACDDTGWAAEADGRVKPCICRQQRRLELLGRRPYPALPEIAQRGQR
jgi:hypothetical protein